MPKYRSKTKKPAGPYNKGKKEIDQTVLNEDKTITNTREDDHSEAVDSVVNEQGEDMHCDVCTDSVERLVQCDRCLIWYCCGCAKIADKLQEILCEFTELHWFCHRCDKIAINAIRSFNDESTPTSDAKISVTSIINTAIKALQESCQEAIYHLQNSIHTVPTTVDNSFEADNMDAESSTLAPGLLPRPESLSVKDISQAVTSCMTEENEKQKRKLNLVVHNLPESTSDGGQQRKRDDINKITEIFKDVLHVTPKVTNAVRLGKKGDKMRLLKISVETEKEKASILRNAVKLRGDSLPQYQKKIFITPDMTPKERDENKALRAKLSDLNKAGNNYKIKSGKIVRRLQ